MTDVVIALSVVFITASVLLLVANHFGFSPIPFYIIAGLVTGTIVDQMDLLELAQWGIAFLVFVFGIRIDLSDIQSVLRDGEVAAITQLAIVAPVAVGIGYLFGTLFGFGDPIRNAIYFGAAATFGSTIVGTGVLKGEIRDNLVHGRLASSIHFFDDLVAIGVVLILSAEVLTESTVVTSRIGYGVLFLVAGLLIYRHGFPLLVRAADGTEELILMGSISILIAFIAASEIVGISIVVGAFAAGIAVRSDGAESLGVRNGIESIKDFFVAIFFVTVGALVQLPSIETLAIAGTLILLVVVVNPIIHTLAFMYEGYDARTSFLASTSLNQVSEFSLIIAIQAFFVGTISNQLFDAIILAAAVTMLLTVGIRRYEEPIYEGLIARIVGSRQSKYIDQHSHVDETLSDHVVIVGYGRQGRQIIEHLEATDRPYVVIDNDPALWTGLEAECQNYVFGDAQNAYTLEKARITDANILISTVAHTPVSSSILEHDAETDLILRAASSREAESLFDSGALFVSVPSVLASDQLIDTVTAFINDEQTIDELQKDHLDTLRELERRGLATRFERS
ncbi:cation:proton antiporter [Halorubraceae archaeon YAN]|nr:cation:proton antiporter [Halorubraceae archaeon YAN]